MDADRCGLDTCLRAIDAGHDVRWFRPTKAPAKDGQGFPGLRIVTDYSALPEHIKWVGKDGLIITTANNKYLADLDRWRQFGAPVFAPTVASAKLEISRSAGMEVMRQHGMNIAPYQEFKSMADAMAFARKSDRAWVFKTLGDNEDKSLSFVSSDPGQLVGWLDRKIKSGLKLKGACILQEKIDMIAEVGVGNFMGSEGFLSDDWEITFEHKKLCSGNYGCATGEQGSLIFRDPKTTLGADMKAMEAHFRALGHMGDLSINGGVDAKGQYWPFEFTCRSGWPATYIQTAMTKGDPVQWMKDAREGKNTLRMSKDAFIGVVCSQPPYPFDDGAPEQVEGNPIYGAEVVWDSLHPAQMMLGKGPVFDGGTVKDAPMPMTTGIYVMIATGHGKTVSAARKSVYNVVDKIDLANMIVRDDIGEGMAKCLPKLNSLGITHLEYE